MHTTELPRPALRSASSSQERAKKAKESTGQWICIPGRQPSARSRTPDFSPELSALLERKSSPCGPRGGSNLPPLKQKPSSAEPPHLATTWSSGWRGGEVPRHKQRGRSSERSTGETGLPRPASGQSNSLLARRTFSLLSHSPERDSASARAPVSLPEANLRQSAQTSTSQRQSLSGHGWRPPRPPALGASVAIEVPSAAPGSGKRTPRLMVAVDGDSRPFSAGKRSRQSSISRSEASTATSRPQSEDRGQSRCSDPGPVRSILRTSQSAERSQSQQQKRVSFSGDCKPARPSSINDLLFGCMPGADESVKLEEETGLTGCTPCPLKSSLTPRARQILSEDL